MDLDALAAFNLVATHGGFGPAARASGRPKASLSRQVRALEEQLGTRLIERGSRALRLTEEGAALHARTEGPLGEIAEARHAIAGGLGRPRGRLRVSSPALFSQVAMGRVAAAFAAAYPDVRLEVVAEDRFVDLVADGIDVLIRVNPHPDHRFVGRKILVDPQLVVAPPGMARPRPGPGPHTVPAVLMDRAAAPPLWNVGRAGEESSFEPREVLRLSALAMVRDAVLAGAGAALLPQLLVADDLATGRLVTWGTARGRPVELWVLHASRRLVSAKVAAFVNHLCAAMKPPEGGV